MNKSKIKVLAEKFESVAHKYDDDINVKNLIDSLGDIITSAKSEKIDSYYDFFPGEYYFQEKNCSDYPELEAAYSNLKLNLTIKDSEYNDIKYWAEDRKNKLLKKD